jgi:hypothetical protein
MTESLGFRRYVEPPEPQALVTPARVYRNPSQASWRCSVHPDGELHQVEESVR